MLQNVTLHEAYLELLAYRNFAAYLPDFIATLYQVRLAPACLVALSEASSAV